MPALDFPQVYAAALVIFGMDGWMDWRRTYFVLDSFGATLLASRDLSLFSWAGFARENATTILLRLVRPLRK